MLTGYKSFIASVAVVLLLATTWSCAKDDGAYSFDKKFQDYSGNVYDYLKSQTGVYDSLVAVIDIVGLTDSLKKTDIELTVFAPTNESFQLAIQNLNQQRKSEGRQPLYLSTIDPLQLDTMVCRYFIVGYYGTDTLSQFEDGLNVPSYKVLDSSGSVYYMHTSFARENTEGFKDGGPKYIVFSDIKNSIFQRYWNSTSTTAVNRKTKNAIVHVLSTGHDFGFGEFLTRTDK